MATNRPLQSYFVDSDFAMVANSQMFDVGMGQLLLDDQGRPNVRSLSDTGAPTVHRLRRALMLSCLWIALACGMGADDRMVRRYAACMADPQTENHRQRGPQPMHHHPSRMPNAGNLSEAPRIA